MEHGSASSLPGGRGGSTVARVTWVSDRFRVVSTLGAGAMGTVCLVDDTELHRKVAIKTVKTELSQDPEFRKRIERECLLHAKVGPHPHIVTLFDRFEVGGQIHLVMEYVEGLSLQTLLERNAERGVAMPVGQALTIGAQCLEALSRIHLHGVIHRDIKPSNIMVSFDDGGAVCAKLMDFGVARLTSDDEQLSRLTTTDSGGPGTPLYMAPEQIDSKTFGELGPATDVYSMGILLYQLFSGSPPFRGTLTEVLNAHVNIPAPRLDEVAHGRIPVVIGDILQRALSKYSGERFDSAKSFRDDLLKAGAALTGVSADVSGAWTVPLVENLPIASQPRKAPPSESRVSGTTIVRLLIRRKRNIVTLLSGLVAFLIVAVGTLSWMFSGSVEDSERAASTGPEGRQLAPGTGPVLPVAQPPVAPAEEVVQPPLEVATVEPAPRVLEPAPQWYIHLVQMDWMMDWEERIVSAPEFVSAELMSPVIEGQTPGTGLAADLTGTGAPGLVPAVDGTLPPDAAAALPAGKEHIVQSGESLSKIAGLYGLSTRDVQWWNKIRDPRSLKVGQAILLYQPEGLPPQNKFFAEIAAASKPKPAEAPAEAPPAAPAKSLEDSFQGPATPTPVQAEPEKPKRTLKDVWRKMRGKG